MDSAPIILIPGFWLGAWAWDEVAATLRADGHDVTALTLPGLDEVATDRSTIRLADHVDAICRAVTAVGASAGRPVVLAVHSGAGLSGYAASDRIPEQIATMVYVDSGPATAPLDPELTGDELPMPSLAQLADDENLDGLSDEQLSEFARRAVPEPAGAVRDAPELIHDERLDVPTTVICTGFPSEQVQEAALKGCAWVGGLAELRDVSYIDLPTSHWPMWSRPTDLARILGEIASRNQRPAR
ncbi:alpha/beta fold hydrolase [Lysinimonas soli]|uniref:Alpha/beta fold hydrolase n=1 Tax=Lysinimonas soli TaxID=1074233 RepID=A0ABW0NNE2_9MICO